MSRDLNGEWFHRIILFIGLDTLNELSIFFHADNLQVASGDLLLILSLYTVYDDIRIEKII